MSAPKWKVITILKKNVYNEEHREIISHSKIRLDALRATIVFFFFSLFLFDMIFVNYIKYLHIESYIVYLKKIELYQREREEKERESTSAGEDKTETLVIK